MPQANPNEGGNWGIMGGAFDPIHCAHLKLAESAFKAFNLTGVFFIPGYNPPHRVEKPHASYEDRVRMTELAVKRYANFCVSRIEEKIKGPGYTLTTVQNLIVEYPRVNLFLILGADNIVLFETWFKPEKIQELVTIVVGGRPGFESDFEKSAWVAKVKRFEMPQIDISSTAIRKLLKENKNIEGLVPGDVIRYIKTRRLYR